MHFIKTLFTLILTVVTILSSAQVVFRDDFTHGNIKGWKTGEDPGIVTRTISNGSFKIASHKSGSYPYTAVALDIDLTRNFEISIAITDQSVDIQAAGLLFGYLDSKNFQSFVTSKNGSFRYGIKEAGVWSDVKTWTKTDYADTEDPVYNKLSVIRQGSEYIFRVNDVTVHQTGLIDFLGNGIGFVVNNEQTAIFDYIQVRYLEEGENYLPNKTLVVREEFWDNGNNWAINDSYPAIFKMENGKYHLEMQVADQPYQSSQSLTIDYTKNFEIKTRMIKKGGIKEDTYGIIFGMSGAENLYFFAIDGNKKYAIGKVEDGTYSYNVNWEESNKVQLFSTDKSYNELSIVKKGSRLYYYVNGDELYNQAYHTLFGDLFGYSINGKQTILVDYLEVNYLN